MQNIRESVQKTVSYLQQNGMGQPVAGIVLGTGLGSLLQEIKVEKSFPYHTIPGFVEATVESHKGMLIYGTIKGVPVVAMQGRFHYYEGYSMQQITYPIRVMQALGIRNLLLSNAAGGLNLAFKKGDIVSIQDHINLLPENPLRGVSDPELGPRFTDMSAPYDSALGKLLEEASAENKIPLHKGIYVAVMGPNLETRAEYRWLRSMGADMVGMSTVPEVIVANQGGMKCVAVSVITDECDPDNLRPVNIEEIIEAAGKADKKLSQVFTTLVEKIGKTNRS